ncbi:MAG: cardiolipin synthase [Lachnospiraceae bacterium]|nr:cardiolipin synthase [Lachnospiraceae bacterium]
MRLAKPKRKGILHIIFSRLLVILALMALQVVILVSVYNWFNEYIPYFRVVITIFTVTMVIYLYNCDMDPSGKLTWMIIMTIAPVPGAIFLVFTRTDIGHRAVARRIEKLIDESRNEITQSEEVLKQLEKDGSGTDDLCRYINRSGCYPIFDNTEVIYFPLGEKKFEALLEELEKAEAYIFMEYFIVEEGYMWGKVLEILARKAKQGVEVRVMYDGMCEISLLPHDYPRRMQQIGIKCKTFTPITPFLSTNYNYRDHRKILVIDGKVAFNGGVNMADEYINRVERFGHWKDTAVMVRGDAAKSFTLMFLQMWDISEPKPDYDRYVHVPPVSVEHPGGYVMPYADCPLDGDKVGENVYMDILYRATDYVHIMTPYLILDGELERALTYAAERGVDVKIILPGIPDKKMAYALAKSHYKTLIRAGIKLYEYTPGFVHAKVFVSDDCKGVVGTINLDYRSLYHHFECATYLYRTDCISDMEADFQDTLSKCREVTPETIKQEKVFYKVAGSVMKLVAPLM